MREIEYLACECRCSIDNICWDVSGKNPCFQLLISENGPFIYLRTRLALDFRGSLMRVHCLLAKFCPRAFSSPKTEFFTSREKWTFTFVPFLRSRTVLSVYSFPFPFLYCTACEAFLHKFNHSQVERLCRNYSLSMCMCVLISFYPSNKMLSVQGYRCNHIHISLELLSLPHWNLMPNKE